jgi:geranylgeranyl diphosphate synthase type II
MLALALEPLLDNVRALGLGRALRILQLFSRMARESAEGQMLELQWTRHTRWHIHDREYLRMVHKKTGWYSFIAPVLVGAIAAGASPAMQSALARFALLLGIAFQIQDDLLSLEQAEAEVGKDALGDLWEGKYTLALLHALRTASEADRLQALAILRRPRPAAEAGGSEQAAACALHDKLARSALELSGAERALLAAALLGERNPGKTHDDVAFLKQLITARDGESLRHARAIALRHVARAQRLLGDELAQIPDSVHRQFLEELVAFVVCRTR